MNRAKSGDFEFAGLSRRISVQSSGSRPAKLKQFVISLAIWQSRVALKGNAACNSLENGSAVL
ncbi:MAG TPA: hypothetical protein DD729_00675 [Rhodobacteraceae bacterium]|nr:hypothetical protein [Paracoccaceae bacterium]